MPEIPAEPDDSPRWVADHWRVSGRGPLEVPVGAWFRMRTRLKAKDPA